LEDPNGLAFLSRLELQSEIQAYLACLPQELRQLVEAAYGLSRETEDDEVPRNSLAKLLGRSRNTIDQQLRRALILLRQKCFEQCIATVSDAITQAESARLTKEQAATLTRLNWLVKQAEAEYSADAVSALLMARKASELANSLLRMIAGSSDGSLTRRSEKS
jgi:hypothetical protein